MLQMMMMQKQSVDCKQHLQTLRAISRPKTLPSKINYIRLILAKLSAYTTAFLPTKRFNTLLLLPHSSWETSQLCYSTCTSQTILLQEVPSRTCTGVLWRMFIYLRSRQAQVATASICHVLYTPVSTCWYTNQGENKSEPSCSRCAAEASAH